MLEMFFFLLFFVSPKQLQGKEPVGFGFQAKFAFQSIWQDQRNSLIKVSFFENNAGNFLTRSGEWHTICGYQIKISFFATFFRKHETRVVVSAVICQMHFYLFCNPNVSYFHVFVISINLCQERKDMDLSQISDRDYRTTKKRVT